MPLPLSPPTWRPTPPPRGRHLTHATTYCGSTAHVTTAWSSLSDPPPPLHSSWTTESGMRNGNDPISSGTSCILINICMHTPHMYIIWPHTPHSHTRHTHTHHTHTPTPTHTPNTKCTYIHMPHTPHPFTCTHQMYTLKCMPHTHTSPPPPPPHTHTHTHTRWYTTRTYSWHLWAVLSALGYTHMYPTRLAQLHTSFASQLESSGQWQWAVFVLLHLEDPVLCRCVCVCVCVCWRGWHIYPLPWGR